MPVRVNQTSCSIFFSTVGAGHAWSTLDDVIFSKTTRPIVDVALTRADNSTPVRYNSSSSKFIFADGFMTAWGANHHLYTITNDTKGWNNAMYASRGRNLSFDSFGMTSPPNLVGSAINTMDRFGVDAEGRAEMNPNLNRLKWYVWKANSVTSIDGYLYMTVSRHSYGSGYIDFRQQAKDSRILISKNNGVTWSPLPPSQGAPFASANVMFPGSKFATPFFVEYGKDGAAPAPAVDASDQFVYAVSNDGYWNNDSHMSLGRVPRPPLPLAIRTTPSSIRTHGGSTTR